MNLSINIWLNHINIGDGSSLELLYHVICYAVEFYEMDILSARYRPLVSGIAKTLL